MKQSLKRVLIAEAEGWYLSPLSDLPYSDEEKADAWACWVRPGNQPHQTEYLPDYFNCVSTIQKTVINYVFSDRSYYVENLERICEHSHFRTINATAEERAEAFGQTLGLW